jgi:hypothetical protein
MAADARLCRRAPERDRTLLLSRVRPANPEKFRRDRCKESRAGQVYCNKHGNPRQAGRVPVASHTPPGGGAHMKSVRFFALTALVAVASISYTTARADDMVSFATGGYATGLRTMSTMHMIDTDHDGMVSQEEWTAFQNKVFSALDKNNSGYIDAKAFYGDPMGPVSFAPGGFIKGLRTKAMFEKMGPNADGKISREQFLSYQQHIFDMMDTDKKKMLTAGEFILKSP